MGWRLVTLLLAAVSALDVELEGLGSLRGKEGEARNKQSYHQFLGIPYAQPPTR